MSATLRVEDFTENRSLFMTPPPVIQVTNLTMYLVQLVYVGGVSPVSCDSTLQQKNT